MNYYKQALEASEVEIQELRQQHTVSITALLEALSKRAVIKDLYIESLEQELLTAKQQLNKVG